MSIVPLLSAQRGSDPVNSWELGVLGDGGSFVAPSNTDNLYSRLVSLGLINSASLVNSCNGGKADALYNFVPSPVQSLDRFVVTRASTKNVLGSAGLYVSVANNVPAFEFNTDGTYRGLLVEPGATNLALRSQEFDNASWSRTRIQDVVQNATIAPDGATTAEKLIADATLGNHELSQSISFTSGLTYTLSCFGKKAEYNFLRMNLPSAVFGATNTAVVDLTTGALSGGAAASARADSFPNGWWRLSLTLPATSTASGSIFVNVANASGGAAYTGDGTSGIFIWQAQLETGSVATSPIVTAGSTANRVADVISLTSASSLIGQDAGWVAVAFESRLEPGSARAICRLTNDSTATVLDGTLLAKSSTDQIQLIVRANNVEVGRRESATNQSGTFGVVIRYNEAGDTSLHVNGARISTVLSTAFTFANSIPVISLGNTQNGTNQLNGHLRAYVQGTGTITEAQANTLSTSIVS